MPEYSFRVFVRNQNNQAPITGAKVEYGGIILYTGTDGYTSDFRAVKDTIITYTITKSGFEPLTRSCYINRDNDECTPYLNPEVDCKCGPWIIQGCAREYYRNEIRTCTPEGCDSQWREVYDVNCKPQPIGTVRWAVRGLWLLTSAKKSYRDITGITYYYKVISPSEWAGDRIDAAKGYCPELNNVFNSYAWNKGLPRVRYTEFMYTVPNKCDGEKAALYDIYTDGPERAATLRRLLDKYPDCAIPDYNYSMLDQLTPHGEITRCTINGLECPNCGVAKSGREIEVDVWMKNMSQNDGEFRFYIYDQNGKELSKEPDWTYKNIKAGEYWNVKKTYTTNLNFNMIDKILNGDIKIVKQI